MAEEAATEIGVSTEVPSESTVAVDMEVENGVSTEKTNGAEGQTEIPSGGSKREREEVEEEESNLKKAKTERSVEEERLEVFFFFNYYTIYIVFILFFSLLS